MAFKRPLPVVRKDIKRSLRDIFCIIRIPPSAYQSAKYSEQAKWVRAHQPQRQLTDSISDYVPVAQHSQEDWNTLMSYAPEKYRALLTSYFVDGVHKGILSQQYGVTPSAIKQRIKTALKHIRSRLEM